MPGGYERVNLGLGGGVWRGISFGAEVAELVSLPEVMLRGQILVVSFAEEGAADAVEACAGGGYPRELVLWVVRAWEGWDEVMVGGYCRERMFP